MKRSVLIYNLLSGKKSRKAEFLSRILAGLEGLGLSVSHCQTKYRNHATEIARKAAARGIDVVVVWGGDGTLNEVAAGLINTRTVMGVIPGGTVNVFAREVGIPMHFEMALKILIDGSVVRIPVGIANDRPFLLMAGVGLDGEVSYQCEPRSHWGLSTIPFWIQGLRLLVTHPMAGLRIRVGEKEIVATGFVAGKTRRYGPHYFLTPQANLREPKLDVVIFRGSNRRDYLRYLWGVLRKTHLQFPDVEHLQTDRLSVATVDPKSCVRYQLDGEPIGLIPLTLGVCDKALSVILPAG